MNEILTTIRQRFIKGLREAPYEFFAPIIAAGRFVRVGLRNVGQQLDIATAGARKKKL